MDSVLAATPFTMPFVKLGRLRSAGVIDLRHGRTAPTDQTSLTSPCVGPPCRHPHFLPRPQA